MFGIRRIKMIIQEGMSIQRKLEILSIAAKYDVACTSSGVDRKGNKSGMGNSLACGICHTFSSDGRCISLLKILFTNECIFDCKYCINRSSNDVVRTSFTPRELCELTMEFYRRNYIEGLFLSSGIKKSPNYTMELLFETLKMLREEYDFNGYIHCKVIPGADPVLIDAVGWYADRISVNLELPTSESLKKLAPHKNRKNILKPMRQIQLERERFGEFLGLSDKNLNDRVLNSDRLDCGTFNNGIYNHDKERFITGDKKISGEITGIDTGFSSTSVAYYARLNEKRRFAPAGQSTQLIIGATEESDYQIMSVSEALYKNFGLKRVFYSAFVNVNNDESLPSTLDGPPLLREHRLYQADWLLRFYGFTTDELLNKEKPNFNLLLDPKCDWALRNLKLFPVEVNKADYGTLLKVPGIGVNSARRIVAARKHAVLDFKDLKKIGVVLKRAVYFITCNGRMMYPVKIDEDYITRQLLADNERFPFGIEKDITYRQLSLFDDVNFKPPREDFIQIISQQNNI